MGRVGVVELARASDLLELGSGRTGSWCSDRCDRAFEGVRGHPESLAVALLYGTTNTRQ